MPGFCKKEYPSELLIRRIALSLQYKGTDFCGWQRQKECISIQSELERAISELDPLRPIKSVAAGRTDSGVHAAAQVVHFDSCGTIPINRWSAALNGRLPKTIRIREAVLRPANWHACHSATYRRYRYTIFNGVKPNLFLEDWSWHRYRFRLDEDLMEQALEGLVGLHDFKAFQRSGSKRAHTFTTIESVKLERKGDILTIEIQATGFLYGMVRLIIGQLVALGEHRITLGEFENRWKLGKRELIKEAAPAKGLCFIRAGYKEMIFSLATWHDCCPRYFIQAEDSPVAPIGINE